MSKRHTRYKKSVNMNCFDTIDSHCNVTADTEMAVF